MKLQKLIRTEDNRLINPNGEDLTDKIEFLQLMAINSQYYRGDGFFINGRYHDENRIEESAPEEATLYEEGTSSNIFLYGVAREEVEEAKAIPIIYYKNKY